MGWFTGKSADPVRHEFSINFPVPGLEENESDAAAKKERAELQRLREEKARTKAEEQGAKALKAIPAFGSRRQCEKCGSESIAREYVNEHKIGLAQAERESVGTSWMLYTSPITFLCVVEAMKCRCVDCGYALGAERTKSRGEPRTFQHWSSYSF